MSVKVAELYGELKLDKKPFDSGLDQAEGKSRGWASRIISVLGGAAGALIKFGGAGAIVAGGGAYMLANAASDLNETIAKTEVVFGKNAEDVLLWGRNAATSMGMSQNAALGARATIGNLFVAMGVGAKETKNMSGSMVELAGDLASFNNMDPTEVLEKLRAGLVGETEPLRSLGVNISAVATEAKAMELGLGAVGRELTAAEKAQANYAIIMEQTKTAQGDFARTSEGMANQQRIVAATFQDTMAQLGQAVVPIFEMILPQLTAGLQAFSDWVWANMPTIKEVIANIFAVIGAAISFVFTEIIPRLVEAFTWIATNVIPVLVSAFTSAGEGVNGFAGVIEWVRTNILPPVMEVINAIATHVIPRLQAAFAGVSAWMTANWPTISSVVGQVAGAISTAAKVIAHVLSTLVIPLVMKVAEIVFPALGAIASWLFGQLDSTFKGIGKVFQFFSDVARNVYTAVEGVWKGLAGFFKGVWSGVSDAFRGGANFLIDIVNGLIGFLNNLRIDIPRVNVPGTDIGVGGGAIDPFNLPTIPRLYTGVRNFGGGLALVGDRGPELMNLPRGTDVFNARDTARMLNGKVVVELRDPDRALREGGYSQRDVERAITEGVRGLITGARHAGLRTG